jgi:hypothetical protein
VAPLALARRHCLVMAELIFLLVALLFGFTCGYGVRDWISRRRRRRYRQVARDRSVEDNQVEDNVNLMKRLRHPPTLKDNV